MGTNKSGWCLTNYHKDCPHVFSTHTCGCGCHTGEMPEPTPVAPKKTRGKKTNANK